MNGARERMLKGKALGIVKRGLSVPSAMSEFADMIAEEFPLPSFSIDELRRLSSKLRNLQSESMDCGPENPCGKYKAWGVCGHIWPGDEQS